MNKLPIIFSFVLICKISSAYWEKTSGPGGGTVYTITNDGHNFYVGTRGAVSISSDFGSSWSVKYMGLPPVAWVNAITTINGNIFAGTSTPGYGVYLTTNNGDSWTPVSNGLTDFDVQALTTIGTNLYVATYYGGVSLSTNLGNSWVARNNGLPQLNVRALISIGPKIIAGLTNGISYSIDSGMTWTSASIIPPPSHVYALTQSGSNLFAATYNGVWISADSGNTWSDVTNGLPTVSYSIAGNGLKLYTGGNRRGVFVSTDNGTNWSQMNNGLPFSLGYYFSVLDSVVIVGTERDGLFRSFVNSNLWEPCQFGFTRSNVKSIANLGTNIFAGTYWSGVYLSDDHGDTWTAVNHGIVKDTTDFNFYKTLSMTVLGTVVIAAMESYGIYLTTDTGATWTQAVSNTLCFGTNKLVSFGTKIFAATECGLEVSSDTIKSWQSTNINILVSPLDASSNDSVNDILIDGSNIFIATNYGISLSTDGGNTWIPKLIHQPALSITKCGANIFAGFKYSGMQLSSDNGNSWSYINNGLPDSSIANPYLLASDGTHVVAGTNEGTFVSDGSGNFWKNIDYGLEGNNISALSVVDTTFFCGNGYSGVFRNSNILDGIENLNSSDVVNFEIFPNPSNGQFTILFNDIHYLNQIEIFDAIGTLLYFERINHNNELLSKQCSFNFCPGVYFVKISDEFSTYCRRLVIE